MKKLQTNEKIMKTISPGVIKDGDYCSVVGGTHSGKSGIVRDIHTSKTGHFTITVVQANGVKFKTLARNVVIQTKDKLTVSNEKRKSNK